MYFHHAAETSSKINKARFCKQGSALKAKKSDWNEQKAEWKKEGKYYFEEKNQPWYNYISPIHSVKEFKQDYVLKIL